MAVNFYMLAVICAVVSAAPPAPPAPPRLYRQPAPAPAHLQQIPYEYYLDNPDMANYYSQPQQKQAASNVQGGAPSRLESLEPDSEVELIPGAQQPQQPPQQNPVSPNVPGLVPGQRVFIVHMPVPGYRPGSIGGYQPVYIVAAAPQGNAGYAPQGNVAYAPQGTAAYTPQGNVAYTPQGNVAYAQGNVAYVPQGSGAYAPNAVNGYQNPLYLDPSGQGVSPLLGYPRYNGGGPGYLLAPQLQALKRPYELGYQEPNGYQPGVPGGQQGSRPLHLAQLVTLQAHAAHAANAPRNAAHDEPAATKQKAQSRESTETKESEEQNRIPRPSAKHVQNLKA